MHIHTLHVHMHYSMILSHILTGITRSSSTLYSYGLSFQPQLLIKRTFLPLKKRRLLGHNSVHFFD